MAAPMEAPETLLSTNVNLQKQHIMNCMFSSWYCRFKDVTIKSRILNVPAEFLEYLHADGVVLPESCLAEQYVGNESDEDEDYVADWREEDDVAAAEAPTFPDFEAEIRKSIKALGGKVFPKLNWSSPKDATWIAFDNSLKCTCASDIYLVLKSSQFVAHDITQPFFHCVDHNPNEKPDIQYQLILRRWQDINPGTEFRCFVKGKNLIAISQRHESSYYEFIAPQQSSIVADIKAFFYHVISPQYPDANYVFDIFRKEQGKVYLLDFNPWSPATDALLYTWEELNSGSPLQDMDGKEAHNGPVFRFIESAAGVQPNAYMSYALPQDFVDLSTGMDANKLVDFMQLKIQSQDGDTSSESGNEEVSPDPIISPSTDQLPVHYQQSAGEKNGKVASQTLEKASPCLQVASGCSRTEQLGVVTHHPKDATFSGLSALKKCESGEKNSADYCHLLAKFHQSEDTTPKQAPDAVGDTAS